MKTENLPSVTRQIVRLVCFGLDDSDITVQFPEFTIMQIAKMRTGQTFKRAVADMNKEIDEQMISRAAEDPVRAYLNGKGMSAAKTLARLASDTDGETPHAVQAKAADSILSKAGYAAAPENITVPVIMLSPDKLASVLNPKVAVLDAVPDSVDGHNGDLEKM